MKKEKVRSFNLWLQKDRREGDKTESTNSNLSSRVNREETENLGDIWYGEVE